MFQEKSGQREGLDMPEKSGLTASGSPPRLYAWCAASVGVVLTGVRTARASLRTVRGIWTTEERDERRTVHGN